MTQNTQQSITERVQALASKIPQLQAEYGEDGFWDAYAGIADPILDDAGKVSDDAWHDAYLYLNSALHQNGLIGAEEIQT